MKRKQMALRLDGGSVLRHLWQQLPERSRTTTITCYARLIARAARLRLQEQATDQEKEREEDADQ